MKYLMAILLFLNFAAHAQTDKQLLKKIKKDVSYLSSNKLEGRRTGTIGESLAADYIEDAFEKCGLKPMGDNQEYIQHFNFYDGLKLGIKNQFQLNEASFVLNRDYSPLSYSASVEINSSLGPDEMMLFDLKSKFEEAKNSPHGDFENDVYESCEAISKTHNIKLLLVYVGNAEGLPLVFDAKSKRKKLSIPVLCITKECAEKFIASSSKKPEIHVQVDVLEQYRNGMNVAGLINNRAKHTVVVGAHFDHLGYGEDHNSLYAGSERLIHHGADDNASGTAALIALTKVLKNKGSKNFNYLFVAFSGEELGLYGSKYFVEHAPIDLKNVKYMINMDMVGRLNDSTHAITLGGFGTSPTWGKIIALNEMGFSIKVDSSGSGPSDHTSFYKKDIPVLFFFTGTHSDYHKPSDVADKINHQGILSITHLVEQIISKSDLEEMVFTKTREVSMGKSSFKVTLGIMPDYTFSGEGVLAEGVSENKPAKKAGILAGDVLLQLGDYKFSDVQGYMKVLGKFNKGETTTVTLKRGDKTIQLEITF